MQDKEYCKKKTAADCYDPVKFKMHHVREIPVSFCSSLLLGYYLVPIQDMWIAYLCLCIFIFTFDGASFWY